VLGFKALVSISETAMALAFLTEAMPENPMPLISRDTSSESLSLDSKRSALLLEIQV